MTRKIEYTTGRDYDTPQVLKIEVLHSDTDDFGFITGKALFVDHSRYIAATVDFVAFGKKDADIGEAVLAAYDSGDYYAKIFSHCV